jgi:peptide-methionine (S)-S-oxide reductase
MSAAKFARGCAVGIFSACLSVFALAQTPAPAPAPAPAKTEVAIFAGGCFWCTESDFDKVPGVLETISGFVGGKEMNPTYNQVSGGGTSHTEGVKVTYDPSKVTYAQLVEIFWKTIDPTVKDQQFCDVGRHYRSGIFFMNAEQQKAAAESKAALEKSGKFKTIHTEVTQATPFWPAEEYHQNYYQKNPIRYNYYRSGCGRDKRLQELWGKK